MSVEHIINQAHLAKENTKQVADKQLRAMTESLREDLHTVRTSHATTPDKQPDQGSLLQQLVHQPSSKTKDDIAKNSVRQMVQKGQLSTPQLQEEIQTALSKFFHAEPMAQDQVQLSQASTHPAIPEDLPHTTERAKHSAQHMGVRKQAKPKNGTLVSIVDTGSEDPTPDPKQAQKSNQTHKKRRGQSRMQARHTHQRLTQGDIQRYTQQVTAHVFSPTPNTKRRIQKERQALRERGMSSQQVRHMDVKVGQVIKQHMVYDLKQNLLRHHMSKGLDKQRQLETSIHFNQAADAITQASQSGKIPLSVTNVLDDLRESTKRDLGNFLFEEAEALFTQHALGQKSLEEYSVELTKVHQAAAAAGFPISEQDLNDKVFQAIDHLGLAPFSAPSSGSDNQKEKPRNPILTTEEALDDTLRYLYMMKALHPSIRESVSLHFKMKKCRNGMIKLGIYTEEREASLQKQGAFLASTRLIEDLQFLFREEATLPHCTGVTYGVIRKKKAFYLRQLRKIGHGLKADEIETIKTAMYTEMYAVIKERVLQLEPMVEVYQNVQHTKALKRYRLVLQRITDTVPVLDTLTSQNQVTDLTVRVVDEAA
jgi:hypothetical protein